MFNYPVRVVSRSLRFRTLFETPDFILQERRRTNASNKPFTYRIVTKARLQKYRIAHSDDLQALLEFDWAYITDELPQLIPAGLEEGSKARRRWMHAHFLQLACELGDTGQQLLDEEEEENEEVFSDDDSELSSDEPRDRAGSSEDKALEEKEKTERRTILSRMGGSTRAALESEVRAANSKSRSEPSTPSGAGQPPGQPAAGNVLNAAINAAAPALKRLPSVATGVAPKEPGGRQTISEMRAEHQREVILITLVIINIVVMIVRLGSFDTFLIALVALNAGGVWVVVNRHHLIGRLAKGSVRRRGRYLARWAGGVLGKEKGDKGKGDKADKADKGD